MESFTKDLTCAGGYVHRRSPLRRISPVQWLRPADGVLSEGSHLCSGTRLLSAGGVLREGSHQSGGTRHAVLRNSGPCLLCSPDACVSFLQFVALCSLVDESYAPIVLDIFSLLLTCNFPYTPWSVHHVSLSRYCTLRRVSTPRDALNSVITTV
ncbi:uncharacterized protein EV420DRAFT_1552646 [Desarmillaria tabescens]|uniref:Uncharacterized protein n=1 Tax=Armillaria tabescens TaxID=1929756 RepID=A0AA39KBA9_ARMTA|nr:uncharacterized protein EV420DRAFT_1552646 [Desarmillaria tabescens]KAK0455668.1 hypothetical protein EV420DRAFT_1552646 [Desarmillaria tabescens]